VTPQEIAVGLSLLTVAGTAINVFVGLRLAAMQAKLKADTSALEVALVRQFVGWKDEVLATINGKYVSAQLIAEIRTSIGRELAQAELRIDRIEKRCDDRSTECLALISPHSREGAG
jgi:hypothetical protein